MNDKNNLFDCFASNVRPLSSPDYLASVASDWKPLKPTEVFSTYWYFAAARQRLFFERLSGKQPPWTDDPILGVHRFTNAYRASDRVSQYLIRTVINSRSYDNDLTTADSLFRILFFKFLNKIETWQLIERELGEISWKSYSFDKYNSILTAAMERGESIFSAAYIMPAGQSTFNEEKKHRNYLRLLEYMMRDGLPNKILSCQSLQQIYMTLRTYPLMGSFLAFQYTIDLNYWDSIGFDESTFVVAGPGARDGIAKCFSNSSIFPPEQIIRQMFEQQETEFKRLGIEFPDLWGRKLQPIDCQNLFCEVDKYSRVAHPSVIGHSKRVRIKQVYKNSLSKPLPAPYYPSKWGINDRINMQLK